MHDSRLHDGTWEGDDVRLFQGRRVQNRREQEHAAVIGDLMAAAYALKSVVNRAAAAMQPDASDDDVKTAYESLRSARSTLLLVSRRVARVMPRGGRIDTMADNMAEAANKLLALMRETLNERGETVEDDDAHVR